MISELLFELVIFLVAVVLHEAGHIIQFYYLAKRFPTVKFTKWGLITVSTEEERGEYTLTNHAQVAFAGIYVGVIYIAIMQLLLHVNMFSIIMIYLVGCGFDVLIIFSYYSNKDLRNIKLKYLKTVDVMRYVQKTD